MRNDGVWDGKKRNDARVKAVEANHMKASLREAALVLQHVVEVLVTTKGRQPISILSNRRSGVREIYGRVLATYHTRPWIDR